MSVLPQTTIAQIEFCEAHNAAWAVAPTAIGITAAQVTALTTATTNARKSFNDAQVARTASKAATTKLSTDAVTMRAQVSDLIRQIKAFAELQAIPGTVYAAAQIPQPAAPTPLAPPGKPGNFTVTLNGDGSLTLSWDSTLSSASSGAFFTIARRLPGQTAFVGVGGSPGSTAESRRVTFTDSTVPSTAGGLGVQYVVQGFRGTRAGTASDAVSVQFGVGSGASVGVSGGNLALAA